MTLDPTSQLFKNAIAITGWPDGLRQRPLSFFRAPERWQLRGAGGWCEEHKDVHYVWDSIEDCVAEALLEHQFRVWLEKEPISVEYRSEAQYEDSEAKGYYVAHTEPTFMCEGGEIIATALTYPECQMMAVVEIDKQAKVKK